MGHHIRGISCIPAYGGWLCYFFHMGGVCYPALSAGHPGYKDKEKDLFSVFLCGFFLQLHHTFGRGRTAGPGLLYEEEHDTRACGHGGAHGGNHYIQIRAGGDWLSSGCIRPGLFKPLPVRGYACLLSGSGAECGILRRHAGSGFPHISCQGNGNAASGTSGAFSFSQEKNLQDRAPAPYHGAL